MADVIKLRARFEGDSIKGAERFGYCMNVFYDIKVKQINSTFLVKHVEDETKDNMLKYEDLDSFLNQWTIFKKYG